MLSTICESEEHSSLKSPEGSIMTLDHSSDPFGINSNDSANKKMMPRNLSASSHLCSSYKLSSSQNSNCAEDPSTAQPSPTVKTPPIVGSDLFKVPANLWSRLSTRRVRNRLVQKNGEYNISLANVHKQKIKFFTDIFTTLIEMKWRWLLIVFTFSFLLSWVFFAAVYYGVMLLHGDFKTENVSNENFFPCISSVKNFLSIFLFSLETQHTIGYGSRYPSEKCPEIVVTLCIQSIFGLMIQTLLAGIVFAKLARPQKRAATLMFSKQACICMRDGRLCLLLRVGDMRKSHLAEAHIRMQLISKRITNEGELLPFHQYEMNVGFEAGLDRIFVVWPITICHVIDETSPLYEFSAEDCASARFEIMTILEGVVQSGATMQARTSYLPEEILWGYRFERLVTYQRENGKYRIDFSKFHNVFAVDTPTLSAKELDVIRDAGINLDEVYQCDDPKQIENGGLTPCDSEHNVQKHPSVVEIGQAKEDDDDDEDENDSLLPQTFPKRRSSLIPLTVDNPQDILRRHRRMSTMSQRLDKWLLPNNDPANSSKSLNNKFGGSNTSLSNIVLKERKNSMTVERKNSVLREHDIM